jgi:hypothetical protein
MLLVLSHLMTGLARERLVRARREKWERRIVADY